MKIRLFIFLLAICSVSSFAQEKAKLTKRETVDYLNKKINEGTGHYRTPASKAFANGIAMKMYYTYFLIETDGDKVILTIISSNYNERKYSTDYFERQTVQTFNPAQIVSITESTTNTNEPLGLILIKLKSNSCLSAQNVSWYKSQYDYGNHDGTVSNSTNEIGFVYLSSDASNFNKIKKALEHLRDLLKAEGDPFAE